MLCLHRVARGRWMEGAIVSGHWSTWMTQSLSTFARINSHGYHLLRKQPRQHIRSNKPTSISAKTCALFHPCWLLTTSINLLLTFVSWWIAPLFTVPACSPSIPPVSPSRPPLHYINIFTLCILLFPFIYFQISACLTSITHCFFYSFLSVTVQWLRPYIYQLFCKPGFSSVLQGNTSDSIWVCTRRHRPTWRLMSLLSKMAPRLNIDHRASVPRTLREAICQGDHLFCSRRYRLPGTLLFFLHLVSGLYRGYYRPRTAPSSSRTQTEL